jgi:undecaprenyl pyrophosphate phosphatase UppP
MRVYPRIAPLIVAAQHVVQRKSIMNIAATLFPRSYTPSSKPENARGLAALLLAASVAALAVVADQLIETWLDDHLFLAWVALWAVVFAGSLLLTGTVRRMSARAVARLDQWAARRAQTRAAARLLAVEKRAAQDAAQASSVAQHPVKASNAPDNHLFYI